MQFLSLNNIQYFFPVFGCADVDVPQGAWYKRDGDFAMVGCEKEELSWALHCEGTEWKGTIGSCPVNSKFNFSELSCE